jgi:hypothetical protein
LVPPVHKGRRRESAALTRLRTVLDNKHLNSADADKQFNWDADVSIDVDVFDVRFFRGNLFVNVETIIGDEFRTADLNQSDYVADLSVSVRLPRGRIVTTSLTSRGTW